MRTIGNPQEFNQKIVEFINNIVNDNGNKLDNLRRASNNQKSALNYARDRLIQEIQLRDGIIHILY